MVNRRAVKSQVAEKILEEILDKINFSSYLETEEELSEEMVVLECTTGVPRGLQPVSSDLKQYFPS